MLKLNLSIFVAACIVVGVSLPSRAAAQVIEGIDVSHWQGVINWPAVAATEAEFVFIKATDSEHINDIRFRVNGPGATAAGLTVGVYHYATPHAYDRAGATNLAYDDAVAEAQWFVDRAGGYMQPGNLPPVLDIEDNEHLGKAVLTAWAKDFLDHVELLTGVRPIVYANTYWASTFLEANDLDTDLWIANWGVSSNPPTGSWDDFEFWQYTDSGSLGGLDPLDRNRFYGTPDDLAAYTIQLMGDMNDDGVVTDDDVLHFVMALENADTYTNLVGFDPLRRGDLTGDGQFNLDDIAPFAQLLGPGAAPLLNLVPEPGTAGLAAMLSISLLRRRRNA